MSDDGRVAIVAGLRTSFARQGTAYRDQSALDLGRIVVRELIERSGIDPREVQQLVYGQVLPSIAAPNIAREVVLGADLPRTIEAYSVSRACATSYQSTVNVAQAIATGAIECGISGGADSSSDVPITVAKPLAKALVQLSRARSLRERVAAFQGVRPADLVPVPPALTEPSTGLTMGESCEKMAQENGIPRAAQDELALRSHQRAAAAWADGRLREQVMTVYVPPGYEAIGQDNTVRADSTLEALAKLKPAFDRRHGTITAGNSSPLTDGASALLLMRADKARALGLPVLATIRSYAFAALDPAGQMLLGPAYAAPRALERAGVTLADMELVDMHEAFAAQVLSNLQKLACARFCRDELGRDRPVGEIDPQRLNVTGGSIALGHPFAATGARQLLQLAMDLRRRGGGLGLATACAAGGLGAAVVLEVQA
jgi:acetyl-CoA acyltransferase